MKAVSPLILVVLSLAACKVEPAPTTPDNTGGDDTGGTDPGAGDPYACTEASDCVAVELQCCDACNGGEAVGVHKDHADAVVADSPRGLGACDDVACTKMACPAWVATCEAGKCAIARGSF